MLSNEERIAEVKCRIAYKSQYREHCRNRALTAVSFVAALMLVIGFSVFMPGAYGNQGWNSFYTEYHTTASVFQGSAVLSYIFIGFMSFVLGAGVTILCFRIRLSNKDKEEKDKKGNTDGRAI